MLCIALSVRTIGPLLLVLQYLLRLQLLLKEAVEQFLDLKVSQQLLRILLPRLDPSHCPGF